MNKQNILIVEDNPEIICINKAALQSAGYQVSEAATLKQAKNTLSSFSPDLIVMDILLPDGSGLDFCREIRDTTDAPILFLTVLGESDQIIEGLRSGGDDYITKPYNVDEFLARIEARLRYKERLSDKWKSIQLADIEIDYTAQRAYVNGKDILLKPKEFSLLSVLIRKNKRYITTEILYREVWGEECLADTRTVKTHIYNLRSKLKESSIKITYRKGKGYILVTE